MDWDQMYALANHPEEITRERFENFVKVCLELDIEQAHFLFSTKMLLSNQSVQHHLKVLEKYSTLHFPSHFAYLIFKAIYCPFEWDDTVKQMGLIIQSPCLRNRVPELIYLLRDIKGEEVTNIFPIYKMCPNAKNKETFLQSGWPPCQHHVWKSLCQAVVPQAADEVDVYDQYLTLDHILQTECAYCSMQALLYKVVFGIYV